MAGRQIRGGRGAGWAGQRFWRWNPDYRGFPAAYPAPPAPPTAEEELGYLQGDLEYLKRELKATEERITEIEKGSAE